MTPVRPQRDQSGHSDTSQTTHTSQSDHSDTSQTSQSGHRYQSGHSDTSQSGHSDTRPQTPVRQATEIPVSQATDTSQSGHSNTSQATVTPDHIHQSVRPQRHQSDHSNINQSNQGTLLQHHFSGYFFVPALTACLSVYFALFLNKRNYGSQRKEQIDNFSTPQCVKVGQLYGRIGLSQLQHL